MKFVPTGITRAVARQILTTKKNSPHIFFGAGVVGIVGAGVMACRATLKLEETLDTVKVDVDAVKGMAKTASENPALDYGEHEYHRDLGYVYIKSAVAIGRLYGPSILVGTASIGALTGSHVALTRRNAALTAVVAAVTQAYNDYRERVKEELGVERELDIYHAVSEEAMKIDGKKQLVKVSDPNKMSPYARFFDETSTEWTKDPEVNRLIVQGTQTYLNNILQSRGHVFLNEAYDALGMERTRAGAVVGWVIGDDGDNYLDFGLFEASERGRAFVNGAERSILLDFNVDGVIYDKI